MNNLMRNIAFAVTALTLVFSCKEESMPDVVNRNLAAVDFTASGHVTKTVFGIPDNGYYPVLWTENQKVALFYNSQTGGQDWTDGAQYVTPVPSEGGLKASFSASFSKEESGRHSFFAFSPLGSLKWMGNEDWNRDGVDEKVVYAILPHDQIPHMGTCDEKGQLLVARADFTDYPENVPLAFTHLSAYGKIARLELPEEAFLGESDDSEIEPGIVGVLLETNKPISGEIYRNFDENTVHVNKDATKYIYLDVNNELKGKALRDVFFACVPMQLDEDDYLQVTVYTTSESEKWVKTIKFSSSHALSFSPGRISSFSISSDGFEKKPRNP